MSWPLTCLVVIELLHSKVFLPSEVSADFQSSIQFLNDSADKSQQKDAHKILDFLSKFVPCSKQAFYDQS